MSSYLSIDLDFWNGIGFNDDNHVAWTYLDEIASICRAKRIPIIAVMNHQQLLGPVNKSGADTLINIDRHSDLTDPTETDILECGSWATFVAFRKTGHYRWIQSGHVSSGECNGDHPIFRANGKHNLSRTDWESIQRIGTDTPPPPKKIMKNVVSVGVVLSPSFCDRELEPIFHQWRRDWKIPYRKGTRNEWAARRTLSPK